MKIKVECDLTPYLDVIYGYRGAKRALYLRAYEELQNDGLVDRDFRVQAFVKVEKHAEVKSPRMIQHRSPKYTLALAHYLKGFEKKFYKRKHQGYVFVTKGMNPQQIAAHYITICESMRDPVALLLDHSKFDSCVGVQLLRWEHAQYLRAVPSRNLRRLLRAQISNACSVAGTEITYRTKGLRMSGDYNTALGNTMINYALLEYFVRGFESRLMVDGDDSVVLVEREDLRSLLSRFHVFKDFGFNTKCQVVEWDKVEYCQARLARALDGYFFLRNPAKILSNLNVLTHAIPDNVLDRYLAGVALGELARVRGVPVLTELLEKIASKVPRNRVILDERSRWLLSMQPVSINADVECLDVWDFHDTGPITIYPRSKSEVFHQALHFVHVG